MTDDDPARLDDQELASWSSLATLLQWLPPALDAQLQRAVGLTHFEFGVLYALDDASDRTLRMGVLAGYANSTLTRLSRAATRLERRGLLRRAPDPTDGRYTLASLTPEGVETVVCAQPGHVSLVRSLVFDNLTAAQARQLEVICTRIASAIGTDPWQPRPE